MITKQEEETAKKAVLELREHFKKLLFPEIIEILEKRNEDILKSSDAQTKKEFRTMCIKIGENNNTIDLIKNLIEL